MFEIEALEDSLSGVPAFPSAVAATGENLRDRCRRGIARCLYFRGDYRRVIDYAETQTSEAVPSETLLAELNRYGGLAALRLGYFRTARLFFERDSLDAHRLLLTLTCLPTEDWETARSCLDRVQSSADEEARRSALSLDSTLREFQELPLKSPAAAALMSAVVPGAGHAYAGYYQTGLASLLLNAALIGSSVELLRNDFKVTGGTVSVLAFGWYIGNIFGSYSAVVKNNRALKSRAMEEYERKNEWLFR